MQALRVEVADLRARSERSGDAELETHFRLEMLDKQVKRLSVMVDVLFQGLVRYGALGPQSQADLTASLAALDAPTPEPVQPQGGHPYRGGQAQADEVSSVPGGEGSSYCVRCGVVQPNSRLNHSSLGLLCAECSVDQES